MTNRDPALELYDPDEVLREQGTSRDLEFALDPASMIMNGVYSFTVGDVHFTFEFGLSRGCPGHVITYDDVANALRGDVDRVVKQRPPHQVRAWVTYPRPHWSMDEVAVRRDRFRQWCHERRLVRNGTDAAVAGIAEEARERDLAARDKAWETLHRYLSKEQLDQVREQGYFEVVGSAGTTFRIWTISNYSGNVIWLRPDGTRGGILCAHCREDVPLADHILTQMLEIVTDEPRWVGIAHLLEGKPHPLTKVPA